MMMLRYFMVLLVSLILVGGVSAVTYYVDYQSGSDSNSGASSSSPFKHAPGDGNAVGNVASVNLRPGDIVKYKGGVSYTGMIVVPASGTSSSYITYDGNADGSWGSGKAVIDLQQSYSQAFDTNGKDYIIVQNFDIKNAEDHRIGASRGIIDFNGGSIYWEIRDNIFHESQNWQDCDLNHEAIYIVGDENHHVIIEGNEFFAVGNTIIKIRGPDFITIRNNDFGGINRGDKQGWFSVALRIELDSNNILIQDNYFHDGWQFAGDAPGGELCHANDYIHTYNTGGPTLQGGIGPSMIIERNKFTIDKQFNYAYGTAFMSLSTNTHDTIVRNNLFVNFPGNWDIIISNGANNMDVYNNIFIIRKHTYDVYVTPVRLSDQPGPNINIVNNIFWTDHSRGTPLEIDDTIQGLYIDYNSYYSAISNKNRNSYAGSGYDWSGWQNLGFDQNGFNGDPKFVYMPDNPAQTSLGDYRLQSGSPLIDAGMNLVSTGFSDDLLGNFRGSSWDIGAYEFGGTPAGATCSDGIQNQGETGIDCGGPCSSCGGTGSDVDTNGDGCVNISEIVAYVELWKNGQVTIAQVVAGVEQWKLGCS